MSFENFFFKTLRCAFVPLLLLGFAAPASAQTFLMMPDSTNNRIALFSTVDGSLVNANYFGLGGGTPIHAMQVGQEIWVSEQLGDRISRWSLTGSALGQIGGGAGGGLDNIRGMGLNNGTVYVTNDGTGNGATGDSLARYDVSGNSLGVLTLSGTTSPFGMLFHQGNMLVSSSSANDDIHRYTLAGSSLGTFHNTTSLNFAEQMDFALNGDILVAGFSSNNIVRLDPNTGALISSFTASGARGVRQLSNGNILWTSGTGVFVFDVNSLTSTSVYTGGGRYLDFVTFNPVPEPGAIVLIAVGMLMMTLRRRDG
jgi:hypothetical protein